MLLLVEIEIIWIVGVKIDRPTLQRLAVGIAGTIGFQILRRNSVDSNEMKGPDLLAAGGQLLDRGKPPKVGKIAVSLIINAVFSARIGGKAEKRLIKCIECIGTNQRIDDLRGSGACINGSGGVISGAELATEAEESPSIGRKPFRPMTISRASSSVSANRNSPWKPRTV